MFFALWPDEALRARLGAAAVLIPPGDAARAYRVKRERYHLTLAFLGQIDARQVEAAQQAADCVRAPPFLLPLDHVGHFAGANVVWIGPQTLPPALAQLKAELDRELLRFGLPIERGSFTPHITCLRGVREAPDAPAPSIDWWAQEFVLVKSVLKPSGSCYSVVRRWPLRPDQASLV